MEGSSFGDWYSFLCLQLFCFGCNQLLLCRLCKHNYDTIVMWNASHLCCNKKQRRETHLNACRYVPCSCELSSFNGLTNDITHSAVVRSRSLFMDGPHSSKSYQQWQQHCTVVESNRAFTLRTGDFSFVVFFSSVRTFAHNDLRCHMEPMKQSSGGTRTACNCV